MPDASPQATAAKVVDATLGMLCVVRGELRKGAGGLTMAQFRVLASLRRSPGASLSDLAGEVGVSPPAMSKLVDALVERDLVARVVGPADRRRIQLTVTPAGLRLLGKVKAALTDHVAGRLAALSSSERATIASAMASLESVIAPEVLA